MGEELIRRRSESMDITGPFVEKLDWCTKVMPKAWRESLAKRDSCNDSATHRHKSSVMGSSVVKDVSEGIPKSWRF